MRVGIIFVCVSLVVLNFQPPIGSLSNTDGPTYPLEVSTDKYRYSLGEWVNITITNVGDQQVTFLALPPDLYVVDNALRIIVDTRHCPHADALIELAPGQSYLHYWDQKYRICEVGGGEIPPSGEPVDEGKYLLSAGMDGSIFGGIIADIWDSVWIEIGPAIPPPVADAGLDQTVNEGDEVQFDGSGSSSSTSDTSDWENRSKEPYPAHGVASTALDGLIYYIGGDPLDCIAEPTNQTISYDPVAKTATWLSTMPGPRILHGVTAVNGKVYAIGGSDGYESKDTVFEYDPLTGQWSTKKPMPVPMEAFGIATVDDRIYIVGGWSTFMFCYPCGEVYEYDTVTDSWSTKASMPTSRAYLTAAALDGSVYAIGGDAPGEVSTVEIYDPSTNAWTTGASMVTARMGLSAEALDGRIYAFGGNGTGMTHINTTEIYDPVSDSWSSGPNMRERRAFFGSATVGNCIYSLGGTLWGDLWAQEINSTEALCVATGGLTYEWDLDDSVDSNGDGNYTNDIDATGPKPTHVYADDGNYTVTLKVTSSNGLWAADTCVITVMNVAPTADAGGPFEGEEPYAVQFTGTFTDPGTSDTHTFQWDFDFDGTTFHVDSTEQSPSHEWLDDFDGDVAFKVIDDDGGWDLDVAHVKVSNLPPDATANGPYHGYEGSPVQFSGNHTDPGPLDTHIYEWDLDYDGATFSPDVTGNPIQNTWPDDHTGNIALRVTDDDGGWDMDVTTISIENVAPIPEWKSRTDDGSIIEPPYPEGKKIRFDATVQDPGTDTFTYDWDFGDGTVILDGSPSVVHAFGDNANYSVVLTVTDDDGGVGVDDKPQLGIYNVNPDVEILLPDCVFFEGTPGCPLSGIFSDPGWLDTHVVHWEFGDGSTDVQTPAEENDPPDATGNFSTTHVYGDDGHYEVNATVIDDDGGENTSRVMIYVPNIPPSLSVSEPSPIDEGQSVSVTVNATDPGSDDIYLVIDWGDGTYEERTYYNDGIGPDPPQSPVGHFPFNVTETFSHVYGDNGVYNAKVTVADDDGGETNESVNITVLNVAPSIAPFGPFAMDEGTSLDLNATSTDPGSDDLTFTWKFEMGATVTRTYYNDGAGPDPYPSPGGVFPFEVMDTISQIYGDNGVYVVTLAVEDDDGGYSNHTTTITVNNVQPTISEFGPFTVDEGSVLALNATASDPGSDDLTFAWEFELGPSIENTYYNDGVGPDPYPSPGGEYPFAIIDDVQHTYGDNGVFNLTLTVKDDDGGSASYETTITVNNVAPSIAPFGPFTVNEGSPLEIQATSTDPGSDDLTFTWAFELGPTKMTVYYNDGQSPDPYKSPWGIFSFSVDDVVQHTYGDNGAFNVILTVEDDDGGATSYVTSITVDNVAPTVDVEAYIHVNFTLRIAGEKWHNVEVFILEDVEQIGYAEITRYPGNPDDQTVSTGEVKSDITEMIMARVLYTPEDDPINGQPNGANPAWLTVSFDDGTDVILKHTFNVRHPETWEWNVDINPYFVGHNITFEATATDPGSDDLTFTWNWGDGSLENETTYYNDGTGPDPYPSPGGTYPFTAKDIQRHTFAASGEYEVVLTVEDDDGGVNFVPFVIVIP